MNGTITLRNLAVAGITCLLAAACSDTDDGNRLPDRQYPMTFTAAVDGLTVTRAAGKDTWTQNDLITVSVDGGVSSKNYKITDAGSGAMEPAVTGDEYYWQNSQEEKTILAWYPAEGATGVDINDQSSGFSDFDYLKTESTTAGFGSDVALSFQHQMAKVKCVLVKGDGISESDITNATVSISGYQYVSFSKGEVSSTDNNNVWITPHADKEALVVPQDMTGKQFIRVTIGTDGAARNYYYTPITQADGNLEAGNQYTYTITVKKTGLVVEAVSGKWEHEEVTGNVEAATFHVKLPDLTFKISELKVRETGNATPIDYNPSIGAYVITSGTFTISYKLQENTPPNFRFMLDKGIASIDDDSSVDGLITLTVSLRSDVKFTAEERTEVGDFYYNDGTWSNVLYTDKTCLGIVYWVGDVKRDNYGLLDSKFPGGTHGLVAALWDLPDPDNGSKYDMGWTYGGYESVKKQLENAGFNVPAGYNFQETEKLQGYINTLALQAYNTWLEESGSSDNKRVKPVKSLGKFDTSHPAPATSSGWYWPSIMELKYMCWGQGKAQGTSGRDIFNAQIEKISNEAKPFNTSSSYWSSTEHSRSSVGYFACYVGFGSGDTGDDRKNGSSYLVRPSLVF